MIQEVKNRAGCDETHAIAIPIRVDDRVYESIASDDLRVGQWVWVSYGAPAASAPDLYGPWRICDPRDGRAEFVFDRKLDGIFRYLRDEKEIFLYVEVSAVPPRPTAISPADLDCIDMFAAMASAKNGYTPLHAYAHAIALFEIRQHVRSQVAAGVPFEQIELDASAPDVPPPF